jgi:hypothetical protein
MEQGFGYGRSGLSDADHIYGKRTPVISTSRKDQLYELGRIEIDLLSGSELEAAVEI